MTLNKSGFIQQNEKGIGKPFDIYRELAKGNPRTYLPNVATT